MKAQRQQNKNKKKFQIKQLLFSTEIYMAMVTEHKQRLPWSGRQRAGTAGSRGLEVSQDPAQLVPAEAGGAGGAGAGSGSGPGAGAGSGTMKQPLLCHCISRTLRTDWIWGAGASQSFQCLKSPRSKMNCRPL